MGRPVSTLPPMLDTIIKIAWSASMFIGGVMIARWAVSDIETMKAALVGLVMVPFVQKAASAWTVKR